MAALLLMSCLLLIFGLAEAGVLLPFRIDAASGWLGVIIPIGILTAIRRIPGEQRLAWVLVACGFIVGTGARQFGLPILSLMGWFGFGVAALATTTRRSAQIGAAQRPGTHVAVWVVLAVLAIAAILFWPPTGAAVQRAGSEGGATVP